MASFSRLTLSSAVIASVVFAGMIAIAAASAAMDKIAGIPDVSVERHTVPVSISNMPDVPASPQRTVVDLSAHPSEAPGPAEIAKVEADTLVAVSTLSGSLTDFYGLKVIEVSQRVWLVVNESWFAFVIHDVDDNTLMGFRSDRSDPSVIHFQAGDPARFMKNAMVKDDAVVVPVLCDDDEFVCQCRIKPDQTCQGISMTAWRCCKDGQFCLCGAATPPDDDCVVGVTAGCGGGAEPAPVPEPVTTD